MYKKHIQSEVRQYYYKKISQENSETMHTIGNREQGDFVNK